MNADTNKGTLAVIDDDRSTLVTAGVDAFRRHADAGPKIDEQLDAHDVARKDIDSLIAAHESLLEAAEHLLPERNCACHISPPCGDCVEWGGLREAVEDGRAALVPMRGGA